MKNLVEYVLWYATDEDNKWEISLLLKRKDQLNRKSIRHTHGIIKDAMEDKGYFGLVTITELETDPILEEVREETPLEKWLKNSQ